MNWYERLKTIFKIASYDMWRRQIENMSKQNPRAFNAWFGGQDRVYLPFTPAQQTAAKPNIPAGVDPDVAEALQEAGYQITDYRGGYAAQGKRVVRIGKLLQQLRNQRLKQVQQEIATEKAQVQQQVAANPLARGQDGRPLRYRLGELDQELQNEQSYWDELINTFTNSSFRADANSGSGYMVVISQNPHDIAQMSTGRDWTSCMALPTDDDPEGGSNHRAIFCEVAEGGFVAYLCRTNDKEIRQPLARLHVRRFSNKTGQSIALPEKSVYGNELPGFQQFVQQWINSKQGDITPGAYRRQGGFYSDTFGSDKNKDQMIPPTQPEDVTKWMRGEGQDAVRDVWNVTNNVAAWKNQYGHHGYNGEEDPEEEEHSFDSEDEANNFVNSHQYSSNDRWRHDLGEDWLQEEEDEDEEGNPVPNGNWANKPFDVRKKTYDRREEQQRVAAERILENPSAYPPETLQTLHDWLFRQSRDYRSGLDELKKDFMRKLPNLITDADVEQMESGGDDLKFYEMLPDGDPRKAQLEAGILASVKKRSQNPWEYLNSWMRVADSRNLPNGDPNPNEKYAFAMRGEMIHEFQSRILAPLEALKKPIPEDIAQNLVKTVSELLAAHTGTKSRGKDTNGDELNLARYLVWGFDRTHTDTPTVQNYYKSLLPFWGDTHGRRLPGMPKNEESTFSPINAESLGRAIGGLGENGRQFLPFLQQKVQELSNTITQIESDPQMDNRAKETAANPLVFQMKILNQSIGELQNPNGR